MLENMYLSSFLPPAVVVDLDGTLFDDRIGQSALVQGNWTHYCELSFSFPYNEKVWEKVISCAKRGCTIFFISERPEWMRFSTERKLRYDLLLEGVNLFDFRLILRPVSCCLSHTEFKLSQIKKINQNNSIQTIYENRKDLRDILIKAGFQSFYPESTSNNFFYPNFKKVQLTPFLYARCYRGCDEPESRKIRARAQIYGIRKFGKWWLTAQILLEGHKNRGFFVDLKKRLFNFDLLFYRFIGDQSSYHSHYLLWYPPECRFPDDAPKKIGNEFYYPADCWAPPSGTYKVQTFNGKFALAQYCKIQKKWSKPVALFSTCANKSDQVIFSPNPDFDFFPLVEDVNL